MSNEMDDILKSVQDQVAVNKTEAETKLDEYVKKREEVDHARVDKQHERLQEEKRIVKQYNNIDLSMNESVIKQTQDDNKTYFKHAKEKRLFLNQQCFHGAVPYHGKNLIFVGATTGSGKSTLSSNISFQDLKQGGNPLVITNEETREDCYNRVTCLIYGWHYVNHGDFDDERVATLNKNIEFLAKKMTVITDNHGGASHGVTTTLEGVIGVLEQAYKQYQETGEFYSSIIIDYYQGITTSIRNPQMTSWEVQERLALYLDNFKNIYPGPIVVLGQLKPGEDDFKNRIEGRKMIHNKATVSLEATSDKEKLATKFTVHKGRYSGSLGKGLMVGYKKGMYVAYTDDFRHNVEMMRTRTNTAQSLKDIGGSNDS